MEFSNILTVGYNRKGQSFFNMLKKYGTKIHSYFFNPSFDFSVSYSWQEQLKKMSNIKTNGIKGNILFNFPSQIMNEENALVLERFLELKNLQIDSATVTTQHDIDLLKKVDPSLKFHISVHVPINSMSDISERYNIQDIYCINLNEKNLFNTKLISQIHNAGIKVKLIANEMCAWNRNEWFTYMLGRPVCKTDGYCGQGCRKALSKENDWLNLTRQGFTKEFIPFFDGKLSIVKISARCLPNRVIKKILDVFTSDKTTRYFGDVHFKKGVPLSFVKKRLECAHDCKECLYCKEIYEKHVKKIK